MQFEIKALHPTDGIVLRRVEAGSRPDAEKAISAEGLEIVSIRQRFHLSFQLFNPLPLDVLQFSQELELLLAAGLSLVESLDALLRKSRDAAARNVLASLLTDIRAGKSFSTTASTRPDLFPPIFTALMSASEQTGGLQEALRRFITYRAQIDAVRKRVIAAIIYPSLLITVGGLVIAFLMLYVVPRFSQIYEDFGSDLPWMSKLLMEWGTVVHGRGLLIVTVTLTVLASLAVLFKRTNTTHWLWKTVSSRSLLRTSLQEFVLARFYRTLGMLLQGGIPIVNALRLSRVLLPKQDQAGVDAAILEIREGLSLSSAMEAHGLAPAIASDLLKVGERPGDIGQKMTRIADFFDEETSRRIDIFVKLFEPALMLAIGLFIAVIVVLLYLPIFELAGNLQ